MEDKKNKTAWWQPAVKIFSEVMGWIVVPIVISLYLGRWLDERYATAPWFFLGLTFLSFIISSVGIVLIATRYIKQIEKEDTNKKNDDNHSE